MPSWTRSLTGGPSPSRDRRRRLRWADICRRTDCQGRWVALRDCRYDAQTGQAVEGLLVDIDVDLAELCDRVRDTHEGCAILYCG